MKKTPFVWFVFVLVSLSLIGELFVLASIALLHRSLYETNYLLNAAALLILIVDAVLGAAYLYRLFLLSKQAIFWTNLVFGYAVFRSVFSITADLWVHAGSVVPNIVEGVVIVVLWVLFYLHLKEVSAKTIPQSIS